MSKKLLAKASLVQLPPLPSDPSAADTPPAAVQPAGEPSGEAVGSGAGAPGSTVARSAASSPRVDRGLGSPALAPLGEARTRTAPGMMAHFMVAQSGAVEEAEQLRAQLQAFDGALPARLLDPQQVRPSRWANRHPSSFEEDAFSELKAEIASSRGNVQPIKVRPARGAVRGDSAGEAGGPPFELVYGHRRHRACLELGLPVLAVVEDLDDQALFAQMERENRQRKSLSAWEQGMMYRRALDEGLFSSQRKLSDALGVDLSLVSKSLTLARLPDAVVSAFASPLDIQFRWAQPLSEAMQKDPDAVIGRAKAWAVKAGVRPAKDVLQDLIAGPASGPAPSGVGAKPLKVERFGRKGAGARLMASGDGALTVEFDVGALSREQQQALRDWLKNTLAA